MNEINFLNRICKNKFIPFWYQIHEDIISLHFGIEKQNLRLLCSLWNYFGECFSDVLLQYHHLQDGEVIRVICRAEQLSSILSFFLHPVLVLDTSLFSYFQTILSKFQDEGVTATFLNGCKGYPYFLKLDSYDLFFKICYLKNIWKTRIYAQDSCFGFADLEALKLYVYEVYSVSLKEKPFASLLRSFRKKS